MSAVPLQPDEFEALLTRLDADRNRAAETYEQLRFRLVRYFDWEGSADAEELADECLTRLARRLASGAAVQSPASYVSGIARLVALERKRAARQMRATFTDQHVAAPEPASEEEPALTCLDKCLGSLSEATRSLLLRYYEGDASLRIDNRAKLADELKISLNSLRNRALRARQSLEKCVHGCMNKMERV